jgi:nitrite reductase/ring-hydroxylating ferredoxin subunit
MLNNPFICTTDNIPDGCAKGFCVEGTHFFILNKNGKFLAYLNNCPHLSVPLEWLENEFFCRDTDLLRCATHGALFLPENGLCVSGPCEGRSLKRVELAVRDGGIYWAGKIFI